MCVFWAEKVLKNEFLSFMWIVLCCVKLKREMYKIWHIKGPLFPPEGGGSYSFSFQNHKFVCAFQHVRHVFYNGKFQNHISFNIYHYFQNAEICGALCFHFLPIGLGGGGGVVSFSLVSCHLLQARPSGINNERSMKTHTDIKILKFGQCKWGEGGKLGGGKTFCLRKMPPCPPWCCHWQHPRYLINLNPQ